ncbi:MAG: cytoplasmic protein [Bacteroidota bacterium]
MNKTAQSIPVRVECYAGHKADQEPVRFKLFDMNFEISEIIDRWYQADSSPEFPAAQYFKVQTRDGKQYMLKHVSENDLWYLWIRGETVNL